MTAAELVALWRRVCAATDRTIVADLRSLPNEALYFFDAAAEVAEEWEAAKRATPQSARDEAAALLERSLAADGEVR